MTSYVRRAAQDFSADETGAVAVEYAIIAIAMFMAIVPGFYYVSSGVQQKFVDIGDYFFG